ncbi:MAG: peptidoglycan-binding domain-containing protein [Patescibacteria group bacterium]
MRKRVVLVLAPLLIVGLFSFVHAQTASELQAQLNALLQQLAILQGQLQTQTGSPSAIPTATGSAYGPCPTITRTLRRGMSGSDVTGLQAFLAGDSRIYPEGTISGYFGHLTEAAVQRFQVRHAIVLSGTPETTGYGVVGPKTRGVISGVCKPGSSAQTPTPIPQTPLPTASGNCVFIGGQVASGVAQTFYSVQSAPTGSTCAAYAQTRQCINGTLSGNPTYQYGICTNPASACTLDGVSIAQGSTYTFFSRKDVAVSESCVSYAQSRTCENGTLSGSTNYQYASCGPAAGSTSCTIDGITLQTGQSRTFYKEKNVLFGQTCAPFGKTRACTNGILGGDVSYQYATCTVAAAGSCTVGTTTVAHAQTRDFYSRTSVSYQESCATHKQSRTCTDGVISGSSSYQFPSCTQIPARTCTVDGIEVAHGASHTFYTANVPSQTPCQTFECWRDDTTQQGTCADISQSRTCTDGTLSGSTQYQYGQCAPVGQRWCKLDGVYVQHNTSRTFYTSSTAPFGQSCTQLGQSRTCLDGTMQGSTAYSHATCTTAAPASCTLNGETVAHNQSYGFYSRESAPAGDICDAYKQFRTCFDGTLSGSASFKYRTCSNSTASLLRQANLAAALAALKSILQSLLNAWDSLF